VDAAQRVEEHGVVGLGGEDEPSGPLGQPALRRPPVQVPLDQEVVAGRAGGGERGVGGGAHGRVLPPAGRQVELQLDLPRGGAQEFGSRLLLPLGHVEPVDEHRLRVVGAAPPGAARDDPAVTQGHALPVGPVHGGAVCLARAQRVGQGVEKVGVALVERTDDQIGHGDSSGIQAAKSAPGRITRSTPGQR
jgi:hypothetical protein